MKIEELDERRLEDPVQLDKLRDPQILPSGHSFSQETIRGIIDENARTGKPLTCPNTRMPFAREEAVKNENLALFIREWPRCKQNLIEFAERERPPAAAARSNTPPHRA